MPGDIAGADAVVEQNRRRHHAEVGGHGPPFCDGGRGGTVQATLGGRVTQFLAKLEFSVPATPLNLQKSDGPSVATGS